MSAFYWGTTINEAKRNATKTENRIRETAAISKNEAKSEIKKKRKRLKKQERSGGRFARLEWESEAGEIGKKREGGEEIKCAIFENRRDWLPTAGHVIETNTITMATRRTPGADGQQEQQQQRAPRFQFFTRRAAQFPFLPVPPSFSPLHLPHSLFYSCAPVTSL